ITDITGDIQGRIEAQITRSLLGQQTPFKAMQEITNILGARASDGIWGRRRRPEVVKGVAARAEAILRTEMTRAANLAHHSQQLVNAELEPEIRKRWMATGDNRTRRSHLRTHIATLEEPIPVGQAFDVGGFKLMFPGDPAGPPGETINCRCRVITVHPEIGQVETTTDRKVKEARAK
ncbi:MAG: phage minor head protein, partial [Gammaproteobacteria bacterium]